MPDSQDIQQTRDAIQEVDREILVRIRDRMDLVESIAEAKLKRAVPFRDQPREEAVLQRVRQTAVELGLDPHEIERLYRLIMQMSLARQQAHIQTQSTAPLRVAYQGIEGSYTHLAAQQKYAGRSGGALLVGYGNFRQVVEAVRDGSVDLALLPIENSTAGGINETYDLLAEGGIVLNAEVMSHIEHCLLALPGTRVEDLRLVLSHPQALLQCETFFRSVPWIRPQAEFDTAGAARKVKEGNAPEIGAVASETAARMLGLEILRRGIQSQSGNYTRFLEIARSATPCPPDTACKSSVLLEVDHRPGALGRILDHFGRHGVNLTKIESRPIPGKPWQYRFYLDLEGHASASPLSGALEAIRPLAAGLRVLGTYPRAEADPPGPSPSS
jgi:chorismate mutase/prephenate dehydratase